LVLVEQVQQAQAMLQELVQVQFFMTLLDSVVEAVETLETQLQEVLALEAVGQQLFWLVLQHKQVHTAEPDMVLMVVQEMD
jgi:hypothetical protein